MEINKRILASMFIITMLAFSLAYGTICYFNDTETSKGNTFTAGTLDLKVDGKDDALGQYFEVGNVKPGDSGSKDIVLDNAGSIDGKAYIHFINVADAPGATPEPEPTPDYGELSQKLYIKVLVGEVVKAEGYLSDIKCTDYLLGTIGGGGSLTVTVQWSIPSDVGNVIMGDIVTFDVEFILLQA